PADQPERFIPLPILNVVQNPIRHRIAEPGNQGAKGAEVSQVLVRIPAVSVGIPGRFGHDAPSFIMAKGARTDVQFTGNVDGSVITFSHARTSDPVCLHDCSKHTSVTGTPHRVCPRVIEAGDQPVRAEELANAGFYGTG